VSKVDPPDLKGQSQELIDWVDKVTEIINFGKVQVQVVSAIPSHVGRRGEQVVFVSGTDGRLFVCTQDQSTSWATAALFTAVTG